MSARRRAAFAAAALTTVAWSVLLSAGGCGGSPERVAGPPAASVASGPAFKDVTKEVGIDFKHDNGSFGKKLFPEIMGSGGAFLDADGDGFLDLVLLSCETLAGAPTPRRSKSRFYHNTGTGAFEDWTERSGLGDLGFAMGAAAGDYDGDGRPDLYVTCLYGDRLFRNAGNGRFVEVTANSGLANRAFSSSAAFLDYDNDGDLDLYVCNYVRLPSPIGSLVCRNPALGLQYCDVHIYEGDSDRLYQNLGNGKFKDVSDASGINAHAYRGLAVLTTDYDKDGWIDIVVANDEHPMMLWRNLGNGRFHNVAGEAGIAVDGRGKMVAGMGLDLADLDRNGSPELYESAFQGEPDVLFEMQGGSWFVDSTQEWDLAAVGQKYLTFGVAFLDYDLDGWRDLMLANGHVLDDVEKFQPGISYAQPAQLLRNNGARRFTDESHRLGDYGQVKRVGRGLLQADYDNDGDPDVLITNNHGAPALLRNLTRENGTPHNWLGVRCVDAAGVVIGARVVIKFNGTEDSDETRVAAGYLGSNDPRVLFGLGKATAIEAIEVVWPDGKREEVGSQTVNAYVTLRRGAGRAVASAP